VRIPKVNNTSPQMNTTERIEIQIGGAVFRVVVNKKSMDTFADKAPKANHGSTERVSWLSGSNTAGARAHKMYQCWNQNEPTRRYSILTAARTRHSL
jgi:hypothetical protein